MKVESVFERLSSQGIKLKEKKKETMKAMKKTQQLNKKNSA